MPHVNNIEIIPGIVSGEIMAVPSKSCMIRTVAAALLASGVSTISNFSKCDDSLAALQLAKMLGAEINFSENERLLTIKGIGPVANGFADSGILSSEGNIAESLELNCAESALCLRLFTLISTLFNKKTIISGEGSLKNRKSIGLSAIIKDLGASSHSYDDCPPFTVQGPINGKSLMIDASESSQILTGLLFVLPFLKDDSEILVNNLCSKPYIDLSLKILNDFGIIIQNDIYRRFYINGKQSYRSGNHFIEGDWSSAAFLLTAAAINGELTVKGLNSSSLQADRKILDILKQVGAIIITNNDSVFVKSNELKPFEFDAVDSPDLVPVLVALATFCEGSSKIFNVNRLKLKESNRVEVLKEEFGKMGVKINVDHDCMQIQGGDIKSAVVNSHNDHRIAMALAIAALCSNANSMKIQNSNCVSKSYPTFFEDLKTITRMK